MRNRKAIIRDRNKKYSNKQQFNMLQILSQNCQGFPWNKDRKLSWISNEVDIILLVETWEHEESKAANIDGFVLWSIQNKRSQRRGIGGIACYIRKTSPPMIGFIKNTLTTSIFGQRLQTLMIKIPTQQFVIFPLLILTSIRRTFQIKNVLTMCKIPVIPSSYKLFKKFAK